MNSYINSYTGTIFPAGLSHRLKPARCAAPAVEKVTAGRLFYRRQGKWTVSLGILVLFLEKEQDLLKSFHDICVAHKFHIAEFFRPIPASFGEAGLGEEEKVFPAVWEQIASHN